MIVYTALVKTDCMTYVWVYKNKPTHEEVIQRLVEIVGAMSYDEYMDITSVDIMFTDVIGAPTASAGAWRDGEVDRQSGAYTDEEKLRATEWR